MTNHVIKNYEKPDASSVYPINRQHCVVLFQTYSPHTTTGKSPTKRPLYRNQDQESINSTAYHEYPNKPFVNSDYQQQPDKPVKALPENNRTGKVSTSRTV